LTDPHGKPCRTEFQAKFLPLKTGFISFGFMHLRNSDRPHWLSGNPRPDPHEQWGNTRFGTQNRRLLDDVDSRVRHLPGEAEIRGSSQAGFAQRAPFLSINRRMTAYVQRSGAGLWHNALAMESLYSIPPLRMARVLCELQPEGVVSIPVEQRGNLLRGAFGTLFRRLVCDPACGDAAHCPRKGTCPHELLFAPRWPAGAHFGMGTPPRAYLFRPPLDPNPCFSSAHPLQFELRLFGEAISTAVLFLRTFQLLASNGIADRRMHLESAWGLDWNNNRCAELVRAGQLTGELAPVLDFTGCFREQERSDAATVAFISPTWIREKGHDLRVPTLPALICRARDRISMLCRLYEGREWEAEFAAVGHHASQAQTDDWNGDWVEYPRLSTRTDEEMPLAGFVGTITCHGIDPRLWPLLRIGQEIHVGRQIVWGHGRYSLCEINH
jgi:hypothetical protein